MLKQAIGEFARLPEAAEAARLWAGPLGARTRPLLERAVQVVEAVPMPALRLVAHGSLAQVERSQGRLKKEAAQWDKATAATRDGPPALHLHAVNGAAICALSRGDEGALERACAAAATCVDRLFTEQGEKAAALRWKLTFQMHETLGGILGSQPRSAVALAVKAELEAAAAMADATAAASVDTSRTVSGDVSGDASGDASKDTSKDVSVGDAASVPTLRELHEASMLLLGDARRGAGEEATAAEVSKPWEVQLQTGGEADSPWEALLKGEGKGAGGEMGGESSKGGGDGKEGVSGKQARGGGESGVGGGEKGGSTGGGTGVEVASEGAVLRSLAAHWRLHHAAISVPDPKFAREQAEAAVKLANAKLAPMHPGLLGSVARMGGAMGELGDAISAEGFYRSSTDDLQKASWRPSAAIELHSALLAYASLLSRLEWNGKPRVVAAAAVRAQAEELTQGDMAEVLATAAAQGKGSGNGGAAAGKSGKGVAGGGGIGVTGGGVSGKGGAGGVGSVSGVAVGAMEGWYGATLGLDLMRLIMEEVEAQKNEKK